MGASTRNLHMNTEPPLPMQDVRDFNTSPLRGGGQPLTLAQYSQNHIDEMQYDLPDCPHDEPLRPGSLMDNPTFITPAKSPMNSTKRVSPLKGRSSPQKSRKSMKFDGVGTGGNKHIDCFGEWENGHEAASPHPVYKMPTFDEQVAQENKDLYQKQLHLRTHIWDL